MSKAPVPYPRDVVLLDLTLTPNRSFDRRHAKWVIGVVGVLFLIGALRFLVLGAWPVIPFMIADTALLVWAFRTSYFSGGGHERLVLTDAALTVTRVSSAGDVREEALEPYFTRVEVEETPLGDAHLFLKANGRKVAVGSFLSAPERREVGAVIARALSDYRHGYNPSTSSMP